MFTLNDIRLPDAGVGEYAQRRHALPWRQRGKFIRPLPWDWISRAAQLSGSALRVALLLVWQAGVQRRSTDLTIPTDALLEFRVNRRGYYCALRKLETARLVTVERRPGRKARLTIVGALQA
jgi:hypothetical protein